MMRTVTVHQPWAWLIAHGIKRVENRKHRTNYRGLVAIHAGISDKSMAIGCERMRAQGIEPPRDYVLGAVIAVAQLTDCVELGKVPSENPLGKDPWACGPFCWILDDIRPLPEPFPMRGMLGLVTAPPELVDYLRANVFTRPERERTSA